MDLADFLILLEEKHALFKIEKKISTNLEIARVTRFLSKKRNKAFLFKNIKESKYPIVTNLFGAKTRISMAIGTKRWSEIYEIGKRLLKTPPKDTIRKHDPDNFTILSKEQIDLTLLGNLVQWDKEQNPYISMANVITKDPKANALNSGIYRIEVEKPRSLWLYFYKGSDISKHINHSIYKNSRLLCSIAIGTPTLFNILSALKMPKYISEIDAYFLIKERPLKTISFKSYPPAPYTSKFIIFGEIIKSNRYRSAYFGNFKGIYNKFSSDTIIKPHYLLISKDALYPASVISTPPSETSLIFKTVEKLFLPLWQRQMPEIRDVFIPEETGFNQLAIVSLKEDVYDLNAKDIFYNLRGLDPPFTQNLICLVNSKIDNKTPNKILRLISGCESKDIFPLETPCGIGLDLRENNKEKLDIKKDKEIAQDIIKRLGINIR